MVPRQGLHNEAKLKTGEQNAETENSILYFAN